MYSPCATAAAFHVSSDCAPGQKSTTVLTPRAFHVSKVETGWRYTPTGKRSAGGVVSATAPVATDPKPAIATAAIRPADVFLLRPSFSGICMVGLLDDGLAAGFAVGFTADCVTMGDGCAPATGALRNSCSFGGINSPFPLPTPVGGRYVRPTTWDGSPVPKGSGGVPRAFTRLRRLKLSAGAFSSGNRPLFSRAMACAGGAACTAARD